MSIIGVPPTLSVQISRCSVRFADGRERARITGRATTAQSGAASAVAADGATQTPLAALSPRYTATSPRARLEICCK